MDNDVNAGVEEDRMDPVPNFPEVSKGGSVNDDLDQLIDEELN